MQMSWLKNKKSLQLKLPQPRKKSKMPLKNPSKPNLRFKNLNINKIKSPAMRNFKQRKSLTWKIKRKTNPR